MLSVHNLVFMKISVTKECTVNILYLYYKYYSASNIIQNKKNYIVINLESESFLPFSYAPWNFAMQLALLFNHRLMPHFLQTTFVVKAHPSIILACSFNAINGWKMIYPIKPYWVLWHFREIFSFENTGRLARTSSVCLLQCFARSD